MASPTPVASTTRGVSAEDRERGVVVLLADVEAGKEAWGGHGKLHRVGIVGEGVVEGDDAGAVDGHQRPFAVAISAGKSESDDKADHFAEAFGRLAEGRSKDQGDLAGRA